MEEPNCKYYDVCGLNTDADPAAGLCILHSRNLEKDKQAFADALEMHRRERGDVFDAFFFSGEAEFWQAKFSGKASFEGAIFSGEASFLMAKFSGEASFERAIFSGKASFWKAIFSGEASFLHATFLGEAFFLDATFLGEASFGGAKFSGEACFQGAKFPEITDFVRTTFLGEASFLDARFLGEASFGGTTFSEKASFRGARFTGWTYYGRATFSEGADFRGATFSEMTDFGEATFSGGATFWGTVFEGNARFRCCSILGTTIFVGRRTEKGAILIFSGAEVDFRDVNMDPPEKLGFRDADLGKCQFLGTNMQGAELTNVQWPEIPIHFGMNRIGVYDEEKLEDDEERPWSHLERLYRELKQNFINRGDHSTAGDFHYGEKEMCRRNGDTQLIHRIFLTLYWLVSGYGERYLRPLFCALILLMVCSSGYLLLGIGPNGDEAQKLKLCDPLHWIQGFRYSLEIFLLQRHTDLKPISIGAKFLRTIQSALGPLILALFALAVRQRLRR